MAWTIFFLVAMGGRRHSDGGCGFFPFLSFGDFFLPNPTQESGGGHNERCTRER